MFEFFDYLISIFSSILGFVSAIIYNIAYFYEMLMPAIDYLFKAVAYIPPIFSIFGVATVLVCIILAVVGRNAGGQQ